MMKKKIKKEKPIRDNNTMKTKKVLNVLSDSVVTALVTHLDKSALNNSV
jgi:hypothetical protein